jgi:hypothetical protein
MKINREHRRMNVCPEMVMPRDGIDRILACYSSPQA